MFANEYILFLLAGIPILWLAFRYFYKKRNKDLAMFISVKNLNILSNADMGAYKKKAFYLLVAVTLCIIALARPQYGTKTIMFTQKSADIIVAMDVSKSMLAEDIAPSRIEKAREVMFNMLSAFKGERVGIIAFEGTAFWQVPMTFDMSGARLFLSSVRPGMLPMGGTRISKPIELALKSVSNGKNDSKALIIITDGEDHDSGISEAVRLAREKNLKIYTIGIGSDAGAKIPLRDDRGRIIEYVSDENGNDVITKLNEESLIYIASETGAQYFRLDENSDITAELINVVKNMTKQEKDMSREKNLEDRFQFFLFIAFVLLLLEMFVPISVKRYDRAEK
jgi:Ca-activated chloride channel family protein